MLTLEDARQAARKRWGRLTPYRIGYHAGLLGIQCENPYPTGGFGWKCFREGLHYGAERRRKDAATAQLKEVDHA